MAIYHIVDIDDMLERWAANRLGADYVVDKIDTSNVDVEQKGVSYQSSGDWWSIVSLSEEFFDNAESRPVTWVFSETVPFNSKVTWTIIKAFKSSKHLPLRLDLSFPVAQEGKDPLQVQFLTSGMEEVQNQKSDALQSTWRLHREIPVSAYTSACACAQVRMCKLNEVIFATDMCISGTIKVNGYKKGKKWKKQVVSASIVDALSGNEALGFVIIENKDDSDEPARQVVFRFEGLCSGEVGTEATVGVNEITSLV